MSDSFRAALDGLEQSAHEPTTYSDYFVDVLPVTGAAVSTIGAVLGSETISASDHVAARLDELQFDLGDGPCWDAMRSMSAVLEPRFRSRGRERWPAFAAAVDQDAVASMFAFPLSVGELKMGAVDLYCATPTVLSPLDCSRASALAGVIGRHVLREALADAPDGSESETRFSRRTIHQATGIVLAQLDVSPDDALLMIQARAFASGQRLMEVAEAVVAGNVRFTHSGGGIEAPE